MSDREQDPARIVYKKAYYARRKAYFIQKQRDRWARVKADPEEHARVRAMQRGYDAKRGELGARDTIPLMTRETAPAHVVAQMQIAKEAWIERFAPEAQFARTVRRRA